MKKKEEFQSKYMLTKDMYFKWARESNFKGKRLVFFIIWVILFALSLICFIFERSFFFCICSIYSFYRAFFRWKVLSITQYNNISKTFGNSNWQRVVNFYKDNIEVIDGNIKTNFDYKNIKKIIEKDNYIKIVFNNSTIRLYSDSFTKSNWNSCKKMLLDKMK